MFQFFSIFTDCILTDCLKMKTPELLVWIIISLTDFYFYSLNFCPIFEILNKSFMYFRRTWKILPLQIVSLPVDLHRT